MDENGFLDDIKREQMLQGMQQLFAFLKSGHSLEEAKKKFAFA